jgi:hypothetical protein
MRHTRVGGVLMLVLLLVTTAAVASAAPAQAPAEPQAPPRTLTGTWVILLEGHQVGLEVEDTAGTLEATLHIMGQRVLLDGDVKDGRFTLTSDAQVGTQHSGGATVKMKLTGTHKPDDTLEGTIDLPHGPMNWTAERLRKP